MLICLACSGLSVSGGLKKRAGEEWGLVGKKVRSGEPVSIILKTLFQYTSSWYTLLSSPFLSRIPLATDPACFLLPFLIVLTDRKP